MLRYFSRSVKPRVFLNTIKVVPKGNFGVLDKWLHNEYDGLDLKLQSKLTELISLPETSAIEDPQPSDLAIDIAVPEYQTGDWGHANLGDIGFPLFWRPRVELEARLFEIKSSKTLSTFSVLQKMPWIYYFARIFTLKSYLSFRSPFQAEDFEYLVSLGLLELIDKMRTSI
ncbi:MAG: hypothetical protein ACYSTO_09770 [Planctomycetota bacterium]